MYTIDDLLVDDFCGIITVSIIKKDIYFKKRYIDYTKEQAIKMFLNSINI